MVDGPFKLAADANKGSVIDPLIDLKKRLAGEGDTKEVQANAQRDELSHSRADADNS